LAICLDVRPVLNVGAAPVLYLIYTESSTLLKELVHNHQQKISADTSLPVPEMEIEPGRGLPIHILVDHIIISLAKQS